ncbi:MAG: hypothetical protein JSU92_00805 [Deltaproteobacteria bacterium]|nr:MAG: hypothetical protein JSU92_00805 [Deltaproteobacteria bacterium]
MKKSGLIAVSLIFAFPLIAILGGCGEDSTTCTCDLSELEELVTSLEAQVTALQADLDSVDNRLSTIESGNALMLQLEPCLTVTEGTINGLAGPHVIFTGANLHVRSGGGATDAEVNGVGNLVVGYNDAPGDLDPGDRGGSHNLIVGPEHKYLSYGGFVAGYGNTVSTRYASVSGGLGNTASGDNSSVSGGSVNTASSYVSSVSGGGNNTASGQYSSISGGFNNTASGDDSSVSGGAANTASSATSSVSGGYNQTMIDVYGWMACGSYSCTDGP